ncbi:MAG TPA: 2-succinyl-5-enolpyruvyl-6-hydroxy-3-cyclohexene-1-carboxylic-acid synthase [Acidimicrobiia bacterium]|nr:2-succinyl-5-enolpyruvyl-6-hydroxy-3-cyclohexene-1-carboxylic-acid synthase [Acidimicrobiia bacterium]
MTTSPGDAGLAPNGATATASVIIDELIRNEVCDLVLAPGSRSAPMALAASARPEMRVWVEVDERSAAFFALGMSKAGGRSAVLTTSGTAAANLYPAAVEADQAMVPLLLITADRPHELRATGANQTIDQVTLFSGVVRWFAEIPAAEDRAGESAYWRSVVSRLVAESRGWVGRRGPVHLNVSFREPVVPLTDDGRTAGAVYRNSLKGRGSGLPWMAVPDELTLLPHSYEVRGRVLVVAGEGADPNVITAALEAGCVVVAEAHSGCRVPGTVTTAHHLLASPGMAASLRPDTVVVLGRAGLSRNLTAFIANVETIGVGDGWFDPDRRLSGMLRSIEFVRSEPDPEWRSMWHEAEASARRVLDAELDGVETPSEPRAARDVAAAVPAAGTLVVGSSMPVRDLDWFAATGPPIKVISNRGASGIDGLVSVALGAGAVGPAVGLVGDLSLLHDQNGFLVAPRPDLVLVVVNNDGGGIFSFLPQSGFPESFEQFFGTPTGIDLSKLADVHGLHYQHVEKASELATAITAGLEAGGVHLIEIRTDRAENVALHRKLTARVVEAVEALLER